MEINYEITPQHLIDFQKMAAKKDDSTQTFGKTFGYISLLLIFGDFVYSLAVGLIDFSLSSILFSLFFRLVLYFFVMIGISQFLFYLHKNSIKKINSENSKNGVICEHRVILEENELIEITDVNLSRHSWIGIGEITENEQFILIPINFSASIIIPKESFESEKHHKIFIETANEYRLNSQQRFNSSYFTRYEIES
jgi:hypothetical protein